MLNKGIEEHDEGVISLAQRTMFRNFLHLLEKEEKKKRFNRLFLNNVSTFFAKKK